jgi:hypothetical protein
LYANRKMFQCKLLSKRSKRRLYWSTFRPVVSYAWEVWVVVGNMVLKLVKFEEKILRKPYRPTNVIDGTWRIKTN